MQIAEKMIEELGTVYERYGFDLLAEDIERGAREAVSGHTTVESFEWKPSAQ